MIVDVHAHYFPASYLERIGRPELPPKFAAPLRGQDIDERLRLLDRVGIDIQVLSVSQAQPYLRASAEAAGAAALANELFLELADKRADRFGVFTTLPLPHIDETLGEIDRVCDAERVSGFTIGCSVGAVQLDDPLLDPVFRRLDELGSIVFLYPVGQGYTEWLSGRNLAWTVGATFEDTAAALRLVLAEVPRRYPRIRFIVPHLGDTLPFLFDRIGRKRVGTVDVIAGLRNMYYDTVSGSVAALTCACSEIGAQRLMLGTDYPYCDAVEFERHVAYLDEAGLDQATLEQTHGGTAATLLSLDGGG